MKAYKKEFIEFALAKNVLQFGEFTLKSGRTSPYFFNAGLFQDGESLARLGSFYASALEDAAVEFDILFGPAYKGIPLAVTTAVALSRDSGRNVPYVFNRKEAKDHGEGGQLVGADLKGRAMIVDDVITAGTAIREVMDIFAAHPDAQVSGALVLMDREEKGKGELSAIQEVARDFSIPVISIISLSDLLAYLEQAGGYESEVRAISGYRSEYGV